ncbi:ABC transporter substrate-binding protein [Photobacterium chitinilyticum]|uniref:Ethanolamine utilization protein EutJ n=1 Tax=Photobacterium chitinilyticum TaxID=2485123 RepID=A0A444JSM8_9GAMM|nr:ABC transporter substrate-binding protein [Photobacterium chitinilyticum]RWX56070.1 ethanolamine utilization protein EutJ [Photobacterium chitinilyticum]
MKLASSLFIVFALLITGCDSQPPQSRELRIGLIAPISGQIPEVGQATIEAAELAVREVNDRGGLIIDNKHYHVALLIEDNQDNAEQTISAALRLINQQNVSAIIGPQASRNAIPAARYAEFAQLPMLSPWSTNPETTRNKNWVYRIAFDDTFQGQRMARFAFQDLGYQKAAVLYDVSSEYNRNLAEVFRTAFRALGGRVVAFELYTRDAPDVTEQLHRIQATDPGVLFLPNYYNEVPEQARLARELGISAQLLGSDTWTQIPAVDRDALEGAFFSTHYAVDKADGEALNFRARFREAYNKDPNDIAALTYDAFGVLFEAVRHHGGIDPKGIRDALNALVGFEGVTGRIEFKGSGDPTKSAVLLEVKEGEFVFKRWIAP